ncbi:MAG: GNAT family N-acetyltransferase, partial [Chloroflexi bacterium]|nr:GNAT family N-acetyltransferase [Chloroflexota bacterium]
PRPQERRTGEGDAPTPALPRPQERRTGEGDAPTPALPRPQERRTGEGDGPTLPPPMSEVHDGGGPGWGLLALDARVVVHGPEVQRHQLPKLAIRAYPRQYVKPWTMKDGTPVTFRPIRPEDEPMMIKFHETLSDRSVYMRYLHPMLLSQRVTHERLSRICFVDYEREIALVAEANDPHTGERRIAAVGRLSKLHGTNDANSTMLVNDAFQNRGLGKELLRQLLEVGRAEKLSRIRATIAPDNIAMQRVCTTLGFQLTKAPDSLMVNAVIEL